MRLIDADQMLADEKEAYYAAQSKIDDITLWRANYLVHHKIKKLIADTPTIDAVPVVRCMDCKHFNPDDQAAEGADWSGWCRYCGCLTDGSDFCSRGIDKDFLDGGDDDAANHV